MTGIAGGTWIIDVRKGEAMRHKKKEIFYLMRNSIVHIFRVEELS